MWTKVSRVSEIEEGKSKIVAAGGKEIALFKISGAIYAIHNTCPHRGGPLGEGYAEGLGVTCPWHAWTFDLKTGACQMMPDIKQPVFKVKVEDGDISLDV